MNKLKEFFAENLKMFLAVKALFLVSLVSAVLASILSGFIAMWFGVTSVAFGVGGFISGGILIAKMFGGDDY